MINQEESFLLDFVGVNACDTLMNVKRSGIAKRAEIFLRPAYSERSLTVLLAFVLNYLSPCPPLYRHSEGA